ncbi:MAG: hypothetical protein N2V77_00680, partial [Canidatus Methanoxibalbensis ujae]|nr:hypothetical protein [Candidatus Methanoxibalbensis ujae]
MHEIREHSNFYRLLYKVAINRINIETKANDVETIFVKISFDEPQIHLTKAFNMSFYEVGIANLSKTHLYGKPVLPVKNVNILLPPGGKIVGISIIGDRRQIKGTYLI